MNPGVGATKKKNQGKTTHCCNGHTNDCAVGISNL